MIERIKRMKAIEGLPGTIKYENPEIFYKNLDESSQKLNTWQGELYFELHRGTYTSQVLVKKCNRKCELLLRQVEILWSILCLNMDINYPKNEIDRLWKLVLLNQFHDVLPGTSIEDAYVDVIKFYKDVLNAGQKLERDAIDLLQTERLKPKAINVFNSTCFSRSETLVLIPLNDHFDEKLFAQVTADMAFGLFAIDNV
jgi:alpha-mannosidase